MLYLLFFIIAIAVTPVIYLNGDFSPWLMLPVLLGIFIGLNALYAAYLYLSSLILGSKKPFGTDNKFCRRSIFVGLDWLMGLLNIGYSVEGAEKLPDGPFVLVCNHRSDFDPMVSVVAIHRVRPDIKLAFISKPENFNVPIAGNYIRRASYLPINRENAREAVKTLNLASQLIKEQGVAYGIYPEGTRSRDCKLLPFKHGAFKIAQSAKVPVVVSAIEGTEEIKKKKVLRRSHVKLSVLDVIPAAEVGNMSIAQISDISREKIADYLGE